MEESLYLLIPLSVVLVFLIAIVFRWSVKSGQFDDLEGPAYRVLMDDDSPQVPKVQRGRVVAEQSSPDERKSLKP